MKTDAAQPLSTAFHPLVKPALKSARPARTSRAKRPANLFEALRSLGPVKIKRR